MVPVLRASSSGMDLKNYICFILLAWDKVSGAGHYQVFYQGSKVWDSVTVNTADPAFKPESPQAYLDLDGELKDTITTSGRYEFQIMALNGDTIIKELPRVTASLGLNLQSIPQINFSLPNLTWSTVTNANEYRISFNGVNADTVNGSTVSYNVSAKLATPPQQTYEVWVDARYSDGNGNPVEINRGIGGFSY